MAARDQSHAAAYRIHRNNIQPLLLVGGKLAERGSQQIGKRSRSIDALIPAYKWLCNRSFHDGGTHHGDGQTGAVLRNQRLGQTLGQGISVRPAQFGGALHARIRSDIRAASGNDFCGSDFPAPRRCRSLAACSLLRACWRSSSVTSALSASCFGLLDEVMQRAPFVLPRRNPATPAGV